MVLRMIAAAGTSAPPWSLVQITALLRLIRGRRTSVMVKLGVKAELGARKSPVYAGHERASSPGRSSILLRSRVILTKSGDSMRLVKLGQSPAKVRLDGAQSRQPGTFYNLDRCVDQCHRAAPGPAI